MKHVFRTLILSILFSGLAALIPTQGVYAFEGEPRTPVGENTAWIRAKLTWQYDAGVKGLDDSLLEFSNDGWTKTEDWYYYNIPVNPGDKVRLINGVRIPYEWDNDLINKKFRLIVTVEGSEAAPGDTGWNKNTKAVFSEDFTVWSQGYQTDEDVWVKEGGLAVRINEYQINDDGTVTDYVNDKVVVPGQFISKIVEIEIDGEKGANVKLIPEKPIKRVYVGNTEVDGKIVNPATALRYEITVKNPAPNTRTITVYDTVDSRLKVTDPRGASMEETEDGGTALTWSVQVEGYGSATVMFEAIGAEGISDKGEVIPNNAEADIVGKRVKSNTVYVGLGPVSPLKMALTRATGDYRITLVLGFIIAILSALGIIIFVKLRDITRIK